MEFDKSRVYTAVNADELKVGSRVIVADTLSDLKRFVSNDENICTLSSIDTENVIYRFMTHIGTYRCLAYLVSEPEEKKLKWTDLKIGDLITYDKTTAMVTEIDEAGEYESHIYAGGRWFSDKELEDCKKVED